MQTIKHLSQQLVHFSPLWHCIPIAYFLMFHLLHGEILEAGHMSSSSHYMRCSAWYTVGTKHTSVGCMTKPVNREIHKQEQHCHTLKKNGRVNWSVSNWRTRNLYTLKGQAKTKLLGDKGEYFTRQPKQMPRLTTIGNVWLACWLIQTSVTLGSTFSFAINHLWTLFSSPVKWCASSSLS